MNPKLYSKTLREKLVQEENDRVYERLARVNKEMDSVEAQVGERCFDNTGTVERSIRSK